MTVLGLMNTKNISKEKTYLNFHQHPRLGQLSYDKA